MNTDISRYMPMDVKDVVIASDADMEVATATLSGLNASLSQVTEERERVTKPLNEALKAERSRWKPVEDALGAAIASLRARIGAYQLAKVTAQREAEAKIASRVGVGRGKLSMERASERMALVPKAASRVESVGGSVTFREEERFEVMDVTMLPHEYVLPNETAIRRALRDGKRLAGVRYYVEMVPVNRRA